MELYPLNATQEDMLSETDWETMENANVVCAYYELPLQYFSAVQAGADCLITRNIKDFGFAKMDVLDSSTFLAHYFDA